MAEVVDTLSELLEQQAGQLSRRIGALEATTRERDR